MRHRPTSAVAPLACYPGAAKRLVERLVGGHLDVGLHALAFPALAGVGIERPPDRDERRIAAGNLLEPAIMARAASRFADQVARWVRFNDSDRCSPAEAVRAEVSK